MSTPFSSDHAGSEYCRGHLAVHLSSDSSQQIPETQDSARAVVLCIRFGRCLHTLPPYLHRIGGHALSDRDSLPFDNHVYLDRS